MNRKQDILNWANEKGLLKEENKFAQLAKLMEESGELAQAVLKGKTEAASDGIGDCFVVLVILAGQLGLDIEECIEHAWSEIKDRKGKMIGGTFVKEIDLQEQPIGHA